MRENETIESLLTTIRKELFLLSALNLCAVYFGIIIQLILFYRQTS